MNAPATVARLGPAPAELAHIREVKGWSADYSPPQGVVMLYREDCDFDLYATPDWAEPNTVALQVSTPEAEELDIPGLAELEAEPCAWTGDRERDCALWVERVGRAIDLIEAHLASVASTIAPEDDETGEAGEREAERDLRLHKSRTVRRDATAGALYPVAQALDDELLNKVCNGPSAADVAEADSRLEFAQHTLDELRATMNRSTLKVSEAQALSVLADTLETQLEGARERLGKA